MGKADMAVNQLLERKEIFADFINGTLFCGKQVLKENDLTLLSARSGIIKTQDTEVQRHTKEREHMKELEHTKEQGHTKEQEYTQGLEHKKEQKDTGEQGHTKKQKGTEEQNLIEKQEPKNKQEYKKLGVLERYGDIRMEAKRGTYSVIFAHETQKNVHYAMPVRSLLYEAMEYTRQVQELEKQHIEKGECLRGDEFLSGLVKGDRLKPVVSVVLYLGDDWDGCRSLYEMLEIDESDESTKQLRPYLPQHRMHLIEAGSLEHPEFFQSCLQHIFAMLKCRQDKDELYGYIRRNRAALERMDHVEIMAAFILLGEQKRVEELFRAKPESEESSMCKAIDDLIHDGEMRGEARGEARGIELGRKAGREEGRQQGESRLLSLISKLIEDGRQNLLSSITVDENLREELYLSYRI